MNKESKWDWLDKACAEAIRNYRDCDRLRLPHCFDVPLNPSGRCIFCGKRRKTAQGSIKEEREWSKRARLHNKARRLAGKNGE